VLPGPEVASLLIQQKYTNIKQNHTANPNFQNSATFLLLAPFYCIETDNTKTKLFYNWQHCFCQGGIDFVKSNSCRTVHATTGHCTVSTFPLSSKYARNLGCGVNPRSNEKSADFPPPKWSMNSGTGVYHDYGPVDCTGNIFQRSHKKDTKFS
jgi:hypothetical protein